MVRNNCCSIDDQRKIYHMATKTLTGKYRAYTFWVREILKEIRGLHKLVTTKQLKYMVGDRRTYCLAAQSNLAYFDVEQLLQKIEFSIKSIKR